VDGYLPHFRYQCIGVYPNPDQVPSPSLSKQFTFIILNVKRYFEVSAFHLDSLSKAFYNFVSSANATRLNRQIYLIKCKQETKIEMLQCSMVTVL
jgi:hypothetical protein